MRNQDRSVGYFILLLLALAAGAVRIDADVPAQAPAVQPSARASLACSPSDAAAQAAFCSASPALAWTDS